MMQHTILSSYSGLLHRAHVTHQHKTADIICATVGVKHKYRRAGWPSLRLYIVQPAQIFLQNCTPRINRRRLCTACRAPHQCVSPRLMCGKWERLPAGQRTGEWFRGSSNKTNASWPGGKRMGHIEQKATTTLVAPLRGETKAEMSRHTGQQGTWPAILSLCRIRWALTIHGM